jgi:hypothetical protein
VPLLTGCRSRVPILHAERVTYRAVITHVRAPSVKHGWESSLGDVPPRHVNTVNLLIVWTDNIYCTAA